MKPRRKIPVIAHLMFAVVLTCATSVWSQNERRSSPAFKATPGIASPQLEALGSRIVARGKELTTLSGEFSDESVQHTPAQILHQVPNMVVLRGFGNRELKFDGKRRLSGVPATEAALLETFAFDIAEGMLAALDEGAAARLLGRGFKPSSTTVPNYTGPSYDIYEVTGVAVGGSPVRKKFYYFDSDSGLLLSTRYDDLSVTPTARVETRFSNWIKRDGSAYPGRIERYENGRRVFSFVTAAASSGPAVDASSFR